MRIYLSGGFHSNWQNTIIKAAPWHKYLNPRLHGLDDPAEYTAWDLAAIRSCDCVFAYMEQENPSGVGLAAECAFGRALNKLVILVDEKQDPYMAIVRALASVACPSLEQGIQMLKALHSI